MKRTAMTTYPIEYDGDYRVRGLDVSRKERRTTRSNAAVSESLFDVERGQLVYYEAWNLEVRRVFIAQCRGRRPPVDHCCAT